MFRNDQLITLAVDRGAAQQADSLKFSISALRSFCDEVRRLERERLIKEFKREAAVYHASVRDLPAAEYESAIRRIEQATTGD